jgi:hypothetical protein
MATISRQPPAQVIDDHAEGDGGVGAHERIAESAARG